MNQLCLDLPAPAARRSDPCTSHKAAARASAFAASHAGRIHVARIGLGPQTAHELAHATGLTVVQIDRRVSQMVEIGLIRVVVVDGKPKTRGGFRVLEAVA